MFNWSYKPLLWVIEMLGIVGYVLYGQSLGANGFCAGFVGGTITPTSINPIADGIALASATAVGVVVRALP